MIKLTLLRGCALFGVPALLAGATTIGTVASDGKFNVNRMQVPGSATLFEGSLVEALKSSVTIQLSNGPRIDLAAGSLGTVYRDRMILDSGTARAKMDTGYRIEARNLVLQPAQDASTAMIKLGPNGAAVTAPQGQMRVMNSTGVLLARLNPGFAMEYDQQQNPNPSAAPSKVQLTGTLIQTDGHYTLQDRPTQVNWELVGNIPSSEVGKTVTVIGYMTQDKPVAGADHTAKIDTTKKAVGGFPCFGGAGAPSNERIQLTGPVEKSGDHYLLTDQSSKVISELVGNVPASTKNGTVMTVKGSLLKNGKPFNPAIQVIDVEHSKEGAGFMMTGCQKALIAGAAIAAGGIIAGFEVSGGPSTPVSQ